MSRFGRSILACALLLAASIPCRAACTATATSVVFNTYDVFNTLNNDITGTITVRCNPSQAYTLSLEHGSRNLRRAPS